MHSLVIPSFLVCTLFTASASAQIETPAFAIPRIRTVYQAPAEFDPAKGAEAAVEAQFAFEIRPRELGKVGWTAPLKTVVFSALVQNGEKESQVALEQPLVAKSVSYTYAANFGALGWFDEAEDYDLRLSFKLPSGGEVLVSTRAGFSGLAPNKAETCAPAPSFNADGRAWTLKSARLSQNDKNELLATFVIETAQVKEGLFVPPPFVGSAMISAGDLDGDGKEEFNQPVPLVTRKASLNVVASAALPRASAYKDISLKLSGLGANARSYPLRIVDSKVGFVRVGYSLRAALPGSNDGPMETMTIVHEGISW